MQVRTLLDKVNGQLEQQGERLSLKKDQLVLIMEQARGESFAVGSRDEAPWNADEVLDAIESLGGIQQVMTDLLSTQSRPVTRTASRPQTVSAPETAEGSETQFAWPEAIQSILDRRRFIPQMPYRPTNVRQLGDKIIIPSIIEDDVNAIWPSRHRELEKKSEDNYPLASNEVMDQVVEGLKLLPSYRETCVETGEPIDKLRNQLLAVARKVLSGEYDLPEKADRNLPTLSDAGRKLREEQRAQRAEEREREVARQLAEEEASQAQPEPAETAVRPTPAKSARKKAATKATPAPAKSSGSRRSTGEPVSSQQPTAAGPAADESEPEPVLGGSIEQMRSLQDKLERITAERDEAESQREEALRRLGEALDGLDQLNEAANRLAEDKEALAAERDDARAHAVQAYQVATRAIRGLAAQYGFSLTDTEIKAALKAAREEIK